MQPINAWVAPYKGKPAIHINGVPTPPQLYALTDWPTGKLSYEGASGRNLKLFADLGFKLFQLDVFFQDMLSPDGELDITYALKQLRGVAERCPDGAVMFRLHTNPPFWWLEKHPQECVVYANTATLPPPDYIPSYDSYIQEDLKPSLRQSFASRLWLDYMGEKAARFCRELAATPEGGRLFAVQIASGVYGENHYWGFMRNDPDCSQPMTRYYRQFLKQKYESESALRAAHKNKSVSFDSAEVPDLKARSHTDAGIFRDPQKGCAAADYYLAQHRCVADSIEFFCRIVKENWPRKIITGVFYGYYLSVFGRAAAGGHLCEQQIMNSPYVDFMSAPCAYNENCRMPGGPGLSRGLIESVTSHGKLWLDEMDQPSDVGIQAIGGMHCYDRATCIGNNRKLVLEPFVRGGGMWYYDFGKLCCGGWWEHPAYLEDIAGVKNIYDRYFEKEKTSPADLLIVLDTQIFTQTSIDPTRDLTIGGQCVDGLVPAAYMSGAAADTIYLSDFVSWDIDRYRAIVFANCILMSDTLRKAVADKLAGSGKNVIWLVAPGYNNGQRLDESYIEALTGMKTEPYRAVGVPTAALCDAIGGQIGGFKPKRTPRGGQRKNLWFAPAQADIEVLGRSADGRIAAAKKEFNGCVSWFFALPPVEPEQLRAIFAACGCHIYSSECGCLLAGAGLLVIQAQTAGKRIITIADGRKIPLDLQAGQTAVLDAESGQIIL